MKIPFKKIALYTILGIVIIALSGCASQPDTYGNWPWFFIWLWHWICAPISLIGSIFMDIRIYEFPNSWGWYDFWFMIWIMLWGGWWWVAAAESD